jgi:sulfite exporter TauE/SafE
MGVSVLISAWLIGALGGLHCLAMCGGFLAATGARDAGATAPTPLLPAATVLGREAAYHGGRVATYMILGAAFGTAGALAMNAAALAPLQRTFYFAANLLLIALGLHLAGRSSPIPLLQTAGARVFGAVLPAIKPLLHRPGTTGRIMLGLVWGLVPCALVYSVLPLALFAGGPVQGALVMLAFGIGTTPNLLALGMLMRRSRGILDTKTLRFTAAAILIAFGGLGLWRFYVADGAPNQGPFCIGPW